MFGLFSFLVILLVCVGYTHGSIAWKATPFNPPSVPLAVRSPYSSAWLSQGAGSGSALSAAWPQFWNGDTLGWAGFVNVDGVSYNFLGAPAVANTTFKRATQASLSWTSTQSVFVMTAGPVQLTVTFLSPVEPSSLVNQSMPFSYMAVNAAPTDGKSHSVQVYSDISAEWVSGTDSQKVNWTTTTGDVIIHQAQLQNQTLFADSGDRIQYGAAYYSSLSSSNTTWQTGQDIVLRAQFIKNGTLLNTQDTNFRAINNNWPCFAFAHDLGNISGQSDAVVFAVGHARDPAINYVTSGGTMQSRSSLYLSQFSSINDAITAFVKDYSNALSRADALDAEVNKDTSAISSNYSDIVALSIRQTFGAIEFTYTPGNTSDVMAFVKAMSSSESISTTDVIYPAWPLVLYTNAAIGKALLLPLLEYQATGQYPNKWACHDLGPAYPSAPGYPKGNDTQMPIEESGNMLIMTLSYTQKTGDKSLITTYYNLLDQWAQYLVSNTLEPASQLSSDAFAGSLVNQTDLALKGIIGIKAMAEIASLVGDSSANSNYNSIASSYVQKWQQMATTSDGMHLTLQYGNSSSWGIAYNLYADQLLGTNIVPSSVYDMQTQWYTSVENTYGVPLDTRNTYTLSNWEIWAAAIMTTTSARNQLINYVHKYLASSLNSLPASDWYDTATGKAQCSTGNSCQPFRARPVVGGHLALLVASASNSSTTGASITLGATSTVTSPTTATASSTSTTTHSSAMSIRDPRTILSTICMPALVMVLLHLSL
ncbi:DUF1793-domain-containing protein [Rhodofomes roseus]|uniref:DUF1793-domain-containing protein n=1 Tax=Rhodofomes roseus TaxID=34475 RepID=A0ABQ8KYA7_9APHY|nr:DUF1793-domain-containing protein [Rhodofomes roseus]KAH9844226.1 DUF1793-domain-containing protein [Rhodofomes roseus]